MATYTNNDGLRIKFGPDETIPARVTEYTTDGPKRLVEIVLDADYLPATDTILLDSYVFPNGVQVTRYEVTAESETFAGGTDVDVNLVDASDGSSNPVAVATLTTANLNGQDSGDLDIALTAQKMISLTTDGTYTTGKTTVLIEWEQPKVETDTLIWVKP